MKKHADDKSHRLVYLSQLRSKAVLCEEFKLQSFRVLLLRVFCVTSRCTECSVSFNYEENLILHMATHDPNNTVCPECGKKFSRMASLKVCEFVTFVRMASDVHAQSRIVLLNLICVHEASRLFVPNVQAHLMLHERDETLICPECGDEFALQVMDNLN